MSSDFSLSDFLLTPTDLIPDDDTDVDADVQWLEYCRIAATVDRIHILDVVLSDLDAEDSPLFDWIDDAIANPHEPGRAKANVVELAKLGPGRAESDRQGGGRCRGPADGRGGAP